MARSRWSSWSSWSGSAEPSEPTVVEIVRRARGGEGKALETLRETGHYLGRGIGTIVKTIDPSRVYVGGVVDQGWDDEALNGIKEIPASALEAVQTGPVVRP